MFCIRFFIYFPTEDLRQLLMRLKEKEQTIWSVLNIIR